MKNYKFCILDNNLCREEIQHLKSEIEKSETERKELKNKYFSLLAENFKKDIEIENLQEKVRPAYQTFENEFSAKSMKRLRLIGFSPKEDSAFVLAALRGLYEGRLGDLSKKTVSGRSKDNAKGPISPKKMSSIMNLFIERTERHGNSSESAARQHKVSKFISSAIKNINKIGH